MFGADLVILCYHAVSEDWPWEGSIAAGTLERQVASLLGRGYVARTLADALAAPAGERSLAVTFDDAFDSVLARGLPVLESLQAPATLFVPTDFPAQRSLLTWSELGGWVGTPYEDELRSISWDGVRRLRAAGWEIGSHTCSHPRLTDLDEEGARAELVSSRAECEGRLQVPCASLAYPYGAVDGRVRALAEDAGYENAVTLGDRLLGPRERRDRLMLSREGIYRGTTEAKFALATAGWIGKLRAHPLAARVLPA